MDGTLDPSYQASNLGLDLTYFQQDILILLKVLKFSLEKGEFPKIKKDVFRKSDIDKMSLSELQIQMVAFQLSL